MSFVPVMLPVSGTTPKRSRAVGLFSSADSLPVTQQIIEGDASQHTERALQNVAAVLKAAGSSLDKVVRCGVFLKNMDDFAAMNAVQNSTKRRCGRSPGSSTWRKPPSCFQQHAKIRWIESLHISFRGLIDQDRALVRFVISYMMCTHH
jgi:enamine deaminase RidA (YjgF/YER057c/UK114 family)